MQKATKTLVLSTLLAGVCVVHAQTATTKDSVTTVDELLKIENAQAREKAKKEAIAAGLIKPVEPGSLNASGIKITPRASFEVKSITGIGSAYKADVTYNGQSFRGLTVGARVDSCLVSSIKGVCVELASTGGKGPDTQTCPTACWTGNQSAPMPPMSLPQGMPTPMSPMPPMPPMGNSVSAPAPVLTPAIAR